MLGFGKFMGRFRQEADLERVEEVVQETPRKKNAVIYTYEFQYGIYDAAKRAKLLREYAAEHGYTVINEFHDVIDGDMRQPSLRECLAWCGANPVDTVIFYGLSALGRSVDRVWKNLKKLESCDFDCFFHTEGFSTRMEDGTLNPVVRGVGNAFKCWFALRWERSLTRPDAVADANYVKRRKRRMKYRKVISILESGLSVRQTVRECARRGIKISEPTVRGLRNEYVGNFKARKG